MRKKIVGAPALVRAWFSTTGTGASVIGYNTEAFPAGSEPQSWKDFWNVTDFPGPRSLYSRFYYNYEAALRAADVPANEIYPATDEKVK